MKYRDEFLNHAKQNRSHTYLCISLQSNEDSIFIKVWIAKGCPRKQGHNFFHSQLNGVVTIARCAALTVFLSFNDQRCSISFGASFRSNIKGSPFSSKTIASSLSSAAFNICSSLAIRMDSVSTNTKYHQLFRLSSHCFRPGLIFPFFNPACFAEQK